MAWTDTRITRMLGLELPIVLGPFGGGTSRIELTAAVSDGGGLGSFGAHHLSPDAISAVVAELHAATRAPFAVNLWLPLPGQPRDLDRASHERSVELLAPWFDRPGVPVPEYRPREVVRPADQIDALLQTAPAAISFIFGVPPREVLREAHRRQIVVIGAATNLDEGRALAEAGVDVVVAAGHEGAGHRPSFLQSGQDTLATGPLTAILSARLPVPVVAAGGIADGRGIVSALALGADAVQLGTAFLVTEESGASPAHRAVLRSDRATSTGLTRAFSGRWARSIRNELMDDLDGKESLIPPWPLHQWLLEDIRKAAVRAGDIEPVSLWAGQGAPLLGPERHAAEVLAALADDTDRVLAALPRPRPGSESRRETDPADRNRPADRADRNHRTDRRTP